MTKIYGIRLHPEIYAAFKLLCDRAGYKRLSEADKRIMLRCIEQRVLLIVRRSTVTCLVSAVCKNFSIELFRLLSDLLPIVTFRDSTTVPAHF